MHRSAMLKSAFSAVTEPFPGAPPQAGRVHLAIGAVYIALEPSTIWTVLGSCLAIIMYAPVLRISAVCHAQLPTPLDRDIACRLNCPHPCRRKGAPPDQQKFVTCSIDYMLSGLGKSGVTPPMIACALIGGADVLRGVSLERSVGRANIQAAREVLGARKLPVQFEDVGGNYGRTLTYYTSTGSIVLRNARGTSVQ